MAGPRLTLVVTPPAQRGLNSISGAAAAAVVEFLVGELLERPRVVGRPLRRELSGLWRAKRGPYRVLYVIDDERETLSVLRIEHRADVYRTR